MNKNGPENLSDRNSTNDVKCGSLSEAVNKQITPEDFRKLFPPKVRPEACVRDDDGYIACGPIVGYERNQPLPDKVLKPMLFDRPAVLQERLDNKKGN